MAQIRRVVEIRKTLNDAEFSKAIFSCMSELSDSFSMRIGVHEVLFRTALTFFSTDDQRDRFVKQVEEYDMLGSFAMTELGHSSSLRDLETTATFDQTNDEWVLHSPSLTSTKWWIGMVGQSATHTVLIAQTIVHGSNIGLNWFLVQLRDSNGRLLPGVTCGDVGAKAGRHGLDNGWIQLTQVRIPRKSMLMRWCTVDEKGDVTGPIHPAIMYAPLIPERLTLTFNIWVILGKALTIACRYGVVRRQGNVNQQILDYQAQQVNLLPAVAGVYVFKLVEWHTFAEWKKIQDLAGTNTEAYLMSLPDIHATSAGLKAVVTWWATERYVLYALGKGFEGEDCGGSVGYLKDAKSILSGKKEFGTAKNPWNELTTYIHLFRFLVVKKGSSLLQKIQKAKELNNGDPYNEFMVELIDLTLKSLPDYAKSLISPLNLCGLLYAANLTRNNLSAILSEGCLLNDSENVKSAVYGLCAEFRKDVVGFTDAFGFPDFILMAPIGRYDGDIYRGS
ncbi:acyl-CoA dehydrogenase/oxidase [Chytridium lagenaria]|nr:acyl-CoA dehydrogenase/oxidase [Chytridium lagenaria]